MAPALVVEIASPGTRRRDEQIKRQLFDRGGVPGGCYSCRSASSGSRTSRPRAVSR